MKKTILYILILLNTFVFGQQDIFDKVTNGGGAANDYSYDIFVTDDGYSYITGKFKSTDLAFGNGISLATTGNYDIYLAKFDPQGQIVWAKQAGSEGSTSPDEGRGIAVDASGNVIVVGDFFNTAEFAHGTFADDTLTSFGSLDVFIAKYDANGNFLWVKQAHSTNKDFAADITIDNDGNYIVTGYYGDDEVDTLVYEGTNIISNGERDIFVLKLNPDGSPIWGISGGGVKNDEATGVVVDYNNDIYVSGYYKDTTCVLGSTTLPFEDNYELFITKINPNGNYLWAKGAYGPGADRAYALDVSGEGDTTIVILTGAVEDTVYVGHEPTMFVSENKKEVFLFAYTGSGAYVTGQTLGGEEDDYAKTISFIPESDGDYFVGGYSKSNIIIDNDTLKNYGKKDAILFKMHKDTLLWMKNYGGSSDDYLNSSVIDNFGNAYFTGNYKSSSAAFGGFTLANGGGYDIWIGEFLGKGIPQLTVPTLFINEFMASNDSSYLDVTTGKYPDWIEIYNAGDEAVDIGGMYVTDDLNELNQWQIPDTASATTTIPAGGYLVLLADKKTEAGVLHVKFKLSGSGEQIGLTLADGSTVIDSLTYSEQTADISMGRLPDSSFTWEFFSVPSPGASNSTGTIVGIEKDKENVLITEYELRQNYPNPFNPTTTINYSIPFIDKQGFAVVQLKIYNILGKEVATLVNEVKTGGNYSVQFDASQLSSGVYYYKLSAGDFVETKKMILLK